MKTIASVFALLIVTGYTLQAQPEVDIPLTVTNNIVKTLYFGLDPAATDGRDNDLGESELPPLPPSGVFDVRFTLGHVGFPGIQGLAKDYRTGTYSFVGQKVHRLKFQPQNGTSSIDFSWNLPAGVTGSLKDVFCGGCALNVPMNGSGGYSLTNFGHTEFVMTIDYDGSLPIQLSSFVAVATGANSVYLEWTTISETNNYGFEVQKSSEPTGNGFLTIPNSFIPGHGTTIDPHTYSYTDATASVGSWYYRLKQIDLDGSVHHTDPVQVEVVNSVNNNAGPQTFSLEQNYPNPFNPSTRIRYSVQSSGPVTLKVFDLLGKQVATLVDEVKQPGAYDFQWVADGLPSGVYHYRLQGVDGTSSRKLVLMK